MPPEPATPTRLETALAHIQSTRRYTLTLVEGLTEDEYFWVPDAEPDYQPHIAWQMGHLAFAQYGLCLFRQRGRQPIDASLMSGTFRKVFRKGSQPRSDRSHYPSLSEIRSVFDSVYEQSLKEIPSLSEEDLDRTVDEPYAGFATQFGALLFAADHEMLHAGQIGMLRRLMGKPPLR